MTNAQGPTQADRETAQKIAIFHAVFPNGRVVYGPKHCDDLENAIADALAAAREQGRAEADAPIPTGHILDDKGVVRRVLGTLPVTADGCICGHGADLFYPFDTTSVDRVRYKSYVNGMESVESVIPPQSMYSTREAALAARGTT